MFTAEELPYHFAVNMKQDSRAWIAGMLQEEAIKLFRDWVKWQENRLDNLKRNLEGLCRVNKFEELIVCKDNQFPELLSIVLQGDLEYDVLVILDHYIKFMDGWNKKIEDDFIWSDFYMKFNKYKPFFLHYASLSDPYYKKAIIDGLTLKK
jgi:hypothetical protein